MFLCHNWLSSTWEFLTVHQHIYIRYIIRNFYNQPFLFTNLSTIFYQHSYKKANLLPTWRAPNDQIMNDVTSEDEFIADEDKSAANDEVSQDGTVANEKAINADGVERKKSFCY